MRASSRKRSAGGPTKLSAGGLGAYIAELTEAGDYPRIALGIAVMSVLVIAMNGSWRPLYLSPNGGPLD